MPVAHHDLCFGCGVANLFGLQMEVEPAEEEGAVSGRFFLKQDHQGPPGLAHGGVLACALDEAMALCVHREGMLAVTGGTLGIGPDGARPRLWVPSCASTPAWRSAAGGGSS